MSTFTSADATKLIANASALDDVMNGADSATITLPDGATVPTVQKLIADKGAALDAETANAANWAAFTGGAVPSSSPAEYSAKAYAQEDLTGAAGGSAKDWAITAEDVEVANGLFSALHYSAKAEAALAEFNNRFLGEFADDTTAETSAGAELGAGDFYFNTTDNNLHFYTGAEWKIAVLASPAVNLDVTGAVVGQALGYPNDATTLEPYTPAGAGDLLKAANETVTGDHTYTGDLIYTATGATTARSAQDRAAEALSPKDFLGEINPAQSWSDALSNDLYDLTNQNFSAPSILPPSTVRAEQTGANSRALIYNDQEDVRANGVVKTLDCGNPISVEGSLKRFFIQDFYVSSEKDGADSFIISIKPASFADTQPVRVVIDSIDTGTDTITAAAHGFEDGNLVWYSTKETEIGGLDRRTYYYAINTTTDTLQLSLTSGGTAIGLSGSLTGDHVLSDGNYWAEDGFASGSNVRGVGDDVAVGISVDGDTRNFVAAQNVVTNLQRASNAVRSAHAFALAGSLGEGAGGKDCLNVVFALNSASDLAGNLFHYEDSNSNVVFALNTGRALEAGIEGNHGENNTPYNFLFLGNAVAEASDHFVNIAGTGGGLRDSYFAFNLFDGRGVDQSISNGDGVVRINQPGSGNIYWSYNVMRDVTDVAFYTDMSGPLITRGNIFTDVSGSAVMLLERNDLKARISDTIFENVTGDAIRAGSTEVFSPSATRDIRLESSNWFTGIAGDILDKDSCANVMGDQTERSPLMDGSIEATATVFVAQRPGIITGIKRVIGPDGGGGGSDAGSFVVKAGSTVLLDNSVPRVSSGGDTYLWAAQSEQIEVQTFNQGDVITVESDGAASRSTRFIVEIEFAYYN